MICYLTIDTEYDFGFTRIHGSGSRRENFQRSILGSTSNGEVGIGYQMDVLDRYGQKAVFFVDPMPALIWGMSAIADIVGPIIDRGHDVQLHMHTEWLDLVGKDSPARGRTGQNIRDFTFDQQCALLEYARGVLVAAGAPAVVAFRAGNYGADDDTLRALAQTGMGYDTSFCPGMRQSPCEISLSPSESLPVAYCGVTEVPIGCIGARHGGRRHAQLTALSGLEMRAAIRHAAEHGLDCFTVVTHSFELMSRDRTRINGFVRRRFDSLCRALASTRGVATGTYVGNPPTPHSFRSLPGPTILPHSALRTGARMLEQAVANAMYGRR